jgi:hypothetical protein
MVPSQAKNHDVSAKSAAVAAKKKESQQDKVKQRSDESQRAGKDTRSKTVAADLAEKSTEDATDEEVDELRANISQDSDEEVNDSDEEEEELYIPSNSVDDTSPDSAAGRIATYKRGSETTGKG